MKAVEFGQKFICFSFVIEDGNVLFELMKNHTSLVEFSFNNTSKQTE